MGVSLTGRKFLAISGDLVTQVTVNREVNISGGPIRGDYITFIKVIDRFILNTHAFAKLRCRLKTRMNTKTSRNHKEFLHRQRKCMNSTPNNY